MLLLYYLLLINATSVLTMMIDKKKARLRKRRTSEGTLFLLALFGGSLGIYAGMMIFRHKTTKKKFTVLIPLIFILQLTGFLTLMAFDYIF